jgi:ubiquinone/menaquinone biosynthesis C-methylase UbiE
MLAVDAHGLSLGWQARVWVPGPNPQRAATAPSRALGAPALALAPDIAAAFDATADDYDAARRRLVPCFDAFYGTALELIAEWGPPPGAAVLDLGAGTGLLAALVGAAFPGARLHLVDVAPAMLEQAKARFAGQDGVTFAVADYAAADLGGPYDLVVSALSIHHLDDAAKRRLFARVLAALRPGGLFVNAEQVQAPTPELERRAHARWRRQAAALGAGEAELAAAEARMRHDRCATLEDQLRWLREAGFAEVDCAFKQWRFAVYGGRRP